MLINTIPRDSAPSANAKDNEFGNLPEWDLSDLYTAPDSPALQEDLSWLQTECAAFQTDFATKLHTLTAEQWLACIARYETIHRTTSRIMTFAGLRYYQKTTDPDRAKFLADMEENLTATSANLVFFTLEINRLEEPALDATLNETPALNRYRPIFERIRAMRPYQLSDELEKFLHDQSVVGAAAWNRLFDETMASMQFKINDKTHNLESALNLFSDTDRTKRESAARAVMAELSQNISLFARITNTLAKEKEVEDRWRTLPTPQASRHLSNHVEPEVVTALRDAVVAAYPKTSHRYYQLKAKWLGLERLQIWDRSAPLPNAEQTPIGWDDARALVLDAYGGFSPKMADIARPFFDKGWIDAGVKDGKAPGAFCHPAVSDAHPFVMLNYMGKQRDVMTLAHELGHGVHQVLAAGQGELLSHTPLTLAETASVFGEMLTFRALLDKTTDKAARKRLLASKTEDMINTLVRQIAFYDFECKVHAARADGELTAQTINDLWMSVQGESLGPAFDFAEGYETFWAYIPHFIHSPFYVYAYAFGDGLVNALYAVYQEGNAGFEEAYFEMLAAGGSKHHKELLAPFGLDASAADFWDKGLGVIAGMIDELETL